MYNFNRNLNRFAANRARCAFARLFFFLYLISGSGTLCALHPRNHSFKEGIAPLPAQPTRGESIAHGLNSNPALRAAHSRYLAAVERVAAGNSGYHEVINDILQHNRIIASARLKWEAAEFQPAIAKAWPDPVLTYGAYFSNVETRVGPMEQKMSVAQKIPFPGKRTLAEEKAASEALIARWSYEAVARTVLTHGKMLLYELYYLDQSRSILVQQKETLESTIQAVQARYDSTQAILPDVLKARLARDDIDRRLMALVGARADTESRLNALRNVEAARPVPPLGKLPVFNLPAQETLMRIAEEEQQDIKMANAAIARDETALQLARKERLPDVTFGVDYTAIGPNPFSSPPDNGQDAVMGFVSINLPLRFGKLRAIRQNAYKNLQASRETEFQARWDTQSEVRAAYQRAISFRDQINLYEKTILPEARQAYKSSISSFRVDEISLLDLLDSQRTLLAAELGYLLQRSEYAKAVGQLEQAVGIDLRDIEDRSNSSRGDSATQ